MIGDALTRSEWNNVLVVDVVEGDNRSAKPTVSPYDEAMDTLSCLITERTRAGKIKKGDPFDYMFDYLKVILGTIIG